MTETAGYKVGFKELVLFETVYDERTIIQYTYDAANRLVHDGMQALTYDPNGNLTNDGTNSYTWDHANRLLSHGGHSYAYDGDGRRISQTVSSVVTKYLLDIQPGLSVVLSQTVDDTDTTHYVYGPRGLHAVQSPAGEWQHPITDALGSIRGYIDPTGGVLSTVHYGEWGAPSAGIVGPAFTGEWRDANALQHHRARYYAPGLAVWTALDPWEGLYERPMSLNGYSWVEGRVVNATDASGRCTGLTEYDCEVCCLEQWRGEAPEIAEIGMQGCYQTCLSNRPCSDQSGLGQWDCASAYQALNLKTAFLRSASRHNRIPNMDDNGFAALMASLIEAEGRWRMGGVSPQELHYRRLENFAASFGCIISGYNLKSAYEAGDYGLLIQYMMNWTVPHVAPIHAYASVGIGNIKLPTAAGLWENRACNTYGECLDIEVSPLVAMNRLGFEVNLLNPFTTSYTSYFLTTPQSYRVSQNDAYSRISGHLLQDDIAIEYVAALLEQGALRAIRLGLTPTAFNSVTWYIRSVQTADEIARLGRLQDPLPDPRGHAVFVLRNMPVALDVLGLTSSWQLDAGHEPELFTFCASSGHLFCDI